MASRLHAHIGTFRQLEILLALHDGGSVKAAAEILFLTQPTVSMQLKKLSEAIGMPLYEQLGRKLHFTDAGLATVKTARDILNSCEQLDMELSDLRGLKSGTLRLAVVTTAKYFIPHLIGPFCKRYPGVDIQFTVGNRQQIVERISQGNDDFYVFSHPPENADIQMIEFLPNNLVAIAAQDHPLADRKRVSLDEICQQDFLIRETGSGTRYAIETFFKEYDKQPNIRMTIESNEAIIHSIMEGLGISILSEHSLAFGEKYGVRKLNVKELPIQTQWSFVWLSEKRLSPIANVFLSYVQTEGKEKLLKDLA
jgi:DNA-binding transcriptional LysR family regulator